MYNPPPLPSPSPPIPGTCAALVTVDTKDNTTTCTSRGTDAAVKTCSVTCARGFAGTAQVYTCALGANGVAAWQGTPPLCGMCVCVWGGAYVIFGFTVHVLVVYYSAASGAAGDACDLMAFWRRFNYLVKMQQSSPLYYLAVATRLTCTPWCSSQPS